LCFETFKKLNLRYYRPLAHWPYFLESRFIGLLTLALKRYRCTSIDQKYDEENFFQSQSIFGLGFNSGDYPSTDDLTLPLGIVQRGAMVGSLGYFKSQFPCGVYVFGDGCAAKEIVYRNELPLFLEGFESLRI
jgi:hypothetical protein